MPLRNAALTAGILLIVVLILGVWVLHPKRTSWLKHSGGHARHEFSLNVTHEAQ